MSVVRTIDRKVLSSRLGLLGHLDQFQGIGNSVNDMDYFRNLATDMLMSPTVRNAFDLDLESQATKNKFGNHICGQSMLLDRRLVQA